MTEWTLIFSKLDSGTVISLMNELICHLYGKEHPNDFCLLCKAWDICQNVFLKGPAVDEMSEEKRVELAKRLLGLVENVSYGFVDKETI